MMTRLFRIGLLTVIGWLVLSACAATSDPAVGVVDQYLKAMVSSDSDQIAKLACKDFEEQAIKDADSFAGVKAELSGAVCKKSGKAGEAALVSCEGKIDATYGTEQQHFDLAGPVYSVVQQGGEWLVCGRQ